MSVNELTAKVKKLKELKSFAEEIAAEITAVEDELKAEMTAQGTEEMTVDVYKLRYKTVKSSRFDSKSLKAELPEIAARYTISTEYRRFSVA